ncbi:hypothetical protein HZC34_04585 [Candidatus Saganbacteria bacterium]|nr:hypothetical protein [Candidatus Saganbacteria bacterium]
MAIVSPITEFSMQMETDYPAPSEKEKLDKLIERDTKLIKSFPFRSDIGEIKFRLADSLVGRNNPGDYARAEGIYSEILQNYGSEYLRARAQIGRAELLTPGIKPDAIKSALALCETARKNLKTDLSDFFMAKTYAIEADLRLVRDDKKAKDHTIAMRLHEKLIKERKAHWYFRARGMLGKAELVLYHFPKKLTEAITLCDRAERLLRERPGDYVALKTKLIRAQLLRRRAKFSDLKKAEKTLTEIIKFPGAYTDLAARAKLELAEISRQPKAIALLRELNQIEGLDPYIAQKVKMVEEELKLKKEKK